MSEADTPQEPKQNQSLPESTAPMDASIPIGTAATSLEIKLEAPESNLEEIAQAVTSEQTQEAVTDSDRELTPFVPASTTFATTENTALTLAQETNLLALIQQLRQRNRALSNRVHQLEQVLSESQETFQSQKAKLQSQEAIIAKASHEITTFQEQITRLFRELESSHQVAQRQQILIETLTEQLESSQERMAQMERECALTQQCNNEQSHLLLEMENTIRELRDRLHRQQRHTLQFKAALEKSLEVPAIHYEAQAEAVHPSANSWHENLDNILTTPGILPKAQPIKPWSAQPDLLADDKSSFVQQAPAEQFTQAEEDREHRTSDFWLSREHNSSDDRSFTDDDEPPTRTSNFYFESDVEEIPGQIYEAQVYDPDGSMTVVSIAEQELSPEELEGAAQDLAWLSQLLEEPELDFYAQPAMPEVNDRPSEVYVENSQEQAARYTSIPIDCIPPPEAVEGESVVSLEDWAPRSAIDGDDDQDPQTILSQPNWPSPVVYPLRPSRGRKTLAAVELPTFPRINDRQPSLEKDEG